MSDSSESHDVPGVGSKRIGSYTTARVTGGRVERVERHVRRLRRDAERLGLALPDPRDIENLFLETARDTFGTGDGVLRIEWSHAPGESLELIAAPRELGFEKVEWRAGASDTLHPGPEARHNTKYVAVDAYLIARAEAQRRGLDEVLLFDRNGSLVEGSGSNFLIVDCDENLLTPAAELGAVEGLGLTIVRENHPAIREAKLTLDDLYGARELMATNGVRGVVSIVELDGEPVGGGVAGPWAMRLRKIFFRE
jgi:branched-subunit amino acid aminotransferase/4-amino-4-deoxychorismate lyase